MAKHACRSGRKDDLGRTDGWDMRLAPRPARPLSPFALGVLKEAPELAAGGVERALVFFGCVVGEKWSALVIEGGKHDVCHRLLPESWVLLELSDDLTAEHPEVVSMFAQGCARQVRAQQMAQERREVFHNFLAWRHIALFTPPASRPLFQIRAVGRQVIA